MWQGRAQSRCRCGPFWVRTVADGRWREAHHPEPRHRRQQDLQLRRGRALPLSGPNNMRATTWPSALGGGGSCTGARGPSARARARLQVMPKRRVMQMVRLDLRTTAKQVEDLRTVPPRRGRYCCAQPHCLAAVLSAPTLPWWRGPGGRGVIEATPPRMRLCAARPFAARALSPSATVCFGLLACLFACLWVALLCCAQVMKADLGLIPGVDVDQLWFKGVGSCCLHARSPLRPPCPTSLALARSLARSGSLPPPSSSFSPGLFLSVLPSAGQNGRRAGWHGVEEAVQATAWARGCVREDYSALWGRELRDPTRGCSAP